MRRCRGGASAERTSKRGRRGRALGWALLFALALAGCRGAGDPEGRSDASALPEPVIPPPERIVLVVVDTLRRDHVGAYGAPRPTPHLDALAARGQRFTRAFSSFHQTTMSMGALFTGHTPSIESGEPAETLPWRANVWCGMNRFARRPAPRWPCLPKSLETLGEAMRKAGYETLGVASNALLFDPAGFSRGFDDWEQVSGGPKPVGAGKLAERQHWARGREAARVNEAAARVLDRRRGDRFFLYVHYMDAHDYPLTRRTYPVAVGAADEGVGGLLGLLEERGLLDGAVVVLTSDHGERQDEKHPVEGGISHRGNPSFEYLIRVPLIVAPAAFSRPDAFVRSEDLHRMLRRLAGLAPGPESDLAPGELFLTERFWQTYRAGGFKSTFARDGSRALLFDLAADPAETRDVSAERPALLEQHRRRVAELAGRLAAEAGELDGLTEEERARLSALGYLREVEEDDARAAAPKRVRPGAPPARRVPGGGSVRQRAPGSPEPERARPAGRGAAPRPGASPGASSP